MSCAVEVKTCNQIMENLGGNGTAQGVKGYFAELVQKDFALGIVKLVGSVPEPIFNMILSDPEKHKKLVGEIVLSNPNAISTEQLKKFNGEYPHCFSPNENFLAVSFVKGRTFSAKDITDLGNPVVGGGYTLAHFMASSGHQWTTDELIEMGNPPAAIDDTKGNTVAHVMQLNNKSFSTEDLIRLGNPQNKSGNSLAHYEVQCFGRVFSKEEISKLGNPINCVGEGIEDFMSIYSKRS
jgi:hypothetical protein